MLIIGRKRNQKIIISDNIAITVLEIGRNRVRFGIQAPADVRVHTKLQSLPEDQVEAKAEAPKPAGPSETGRRAYAAGKSGKS